jgi:two-component system, NarL family, invasion response regulator UvrY
MRVLIADDHPLFRRGLVQMLRSYPGIEVCGEAGDSIEALALAQTTDADVVTLDLAMPGRGGLDVLAEIRRLRPSLPVLVLSMFGEHQFSVQSMKLGASGYVTKDADESVIVEAIRTVASGGTYVSQALADELVKQLNREGDATTAALSPREFQVLRLLAQGRLVTEIANELSLSVKTVSTYRQRLLEKLGARTTADLIRIGILRGLS